MHAHQQVIPVQVAYEDELRGVFDATDRLTVGIEEEVILVDSRSGCPAPVAEEVVVGAHDPAIKSELPSCQVELVTRPHRTVEGAIRELTEARLMLAAACGSSVEPIAAAVHPWTPSVPLNRSERHRRIEREFGEVARRQLVGSLQVHVAVGSADATLAVHDALRGRLPDIAALAASAPFHEGRDVGLASVRPLICGQLPRQGVPPAIGSWSRFAAEMSWGGFDGPAADPRMWWWELRPHLLHGTLEVRVPDVQASLGAAEAVVRTVHALVGHLLERHEAGQVLDVPETWRIEENRWRALRDGVHGELLDLVTGEPVLTRRRLAQLLDTIEPHAGDGGLDGARALLSGNGADDLRAVGVTGSVRLLADAFPPEGGSDA